MTSPPAKKLVRTAAALVIGNEILSGKIADANVHELAKMLRALGIRLERVVMLPDEMEPLAREIRHLSDSFDVVFTSGGVGPTHDDITIEAVARAFELPVIEHPELAALMRGLYGDRLTDSHLLMARVPEGSELRASREVEWPTPVTRNVWMLPGIPDLFRVKLLTAREHLRGAAPFVSRSLYLRTEEALLKPLLDQVVARHPEVEIGSYPKWFDPEYRTLITFDARDAALAGKALADLQSLVAPGEIVRTA